MTLSATAMAEAFNEHSSSAWYMLLTISHPDLATPLRLVNSRSDLISNGHTFTWFPFTVVLPDDDGENSPRAKLKIDNVSREIYRTIWALDPAPYIQIDVVVSDDPNQIEYTAGNMRLVNVTVDELFITGELAPDISVLDPFPGDSFSPGKFPALF